MMQYNDLEDARGKRLEDLFSESDIEDKVEFEEDLREEDRAEQQEVGGGVSDITMGLPDQEEHGEKKTNTVLVKCSSCGYSYDIEYGKDSFTCIHCFSKSAIHYTEEGVSVEPFVKIGEPPVVAEKTGDGIFARLLRIFKRE